MCVVWLSQMLLVKCLCVLSRYLRCYMSNVCVLSGYLSPVVEFFNVTPNPIYGIHNPVGLKYLTRLRVGLSHLRAHKHQYNFSDTSSKYCSCRDNCWTLSTTLPYLFAYLFAIKTWDLMVLLFPMTNDLIFSCVECITSIIYYHWYVYLLHLSWGEREGGGGGGRFSLGPSLSLCLEGPKVGLGRVSLYIYVWFFM